MNLSKPLSLLVALCVFLAPLLAGAGVMTMESQAAVKAQAVLTHDHSASCHSSQEGSQLSDTNLPHGCCPSLLAVLSDMPWMQKIQNTPSLIPFRPSLSLASRIEGLYRPPRQNS